MACTPQEGERKPSRDTRYAQQHKDKSRACCPVSRALSLSRALVAEAILELFDVGESTVEARRLRRSCVVLDVVVVRTQAKDTCPLIALAALGTHTARAKARDGAARVLTDAVHAPAGSLRGASRETSWSQVGAGRSREIQGDQWRSMEINGDPG